MKNEDLTLGLCDPRALPPGSVRGSPRAGMGVTVLALWPRSVGSQTRSGWRRLDPRPEGHASWKVCQSMASCRTAERTVPNFRSRPPQSGRTVARWVAGLSHFR